MRLASNAALFFLIAASSAHVHAAPAAPQGPRANVAQASSVQLGTPQTWRAALRSPNWQRRILAIEALARLGDLDGMLAATRDRHPVVRRSACEALGPYHGRDKARATVVLASLVHDSDRGVREAAALALGWMRVRSARAIQALLEASHDGFARVRTQAAISLGELRGTSLDRAIVARLSELVRESNVFVRDAATQSLAWTLRDAPSSARQLVLLLRATDWRVRRAACVALDGAAAWWRHEGRGAERAFVGHALRRATHDSFWRVRDAAKLALASLGDA